MEYGTKCVAYWYGMWHTRKTVSKSAWEFGKSLYSFSIPLFMRRNCFFSLGPTSVAITRSAHYLNVATVKNKLPWKYRLVEKQKAFHPNSLFLTLAFPAPRPLVKRLWAGSIPHTKRKLKPENKCVVSVVLFWFIQTLIPSRWPTIPIFPGLRGFPRLEACNLNLQQSQAHSDHWSPQVSWTGVGSGRAEAQARFL